MPLPILPSVIPGSDGAGIVLAAGSAVPNLKPGSKVIMHLAPRVAVDQLPGFAEINAGLGQTSHGTLCRRGVFHHTALVPMLDSMSFEEAASLTCSGLTAWNALMGLRGREVKKGDWVLVQGTGGVSITALQVSSMTD